MLGQLKLYPNHFDLENVCICIFTIKRVKLASNIGTYIIHLEQYLCPSNPFHCSLSTIFVYERFEISVQCMSWEKGYTSVVCKCSNLDVSKDGHAMWFPVNDYHPRAMVLLYLLFPIGMVLLYLSRVSEKSNYLTKKAL